MTTRILLTGGTGQLGRNLALALQELGKMKVPARAEFDLASPTSMRRMLDEWRPGLIVNAAAYTAVDRAESEPELALAVSGAAPAAMAGWAARNDAAIVHYSTDYVFDGAAPRAYREDDKTGPISVYGASKLTGEAAVRDSGADHLIIRTSWLYAAQGQNFLHTILRLARERETLCIVDDQTGAPTSAQWLARISARIIAKPPFAGDRSGVLHAAAAGSVSWHGFACAIVERARARGWPVKVETISPISTSGYPTPAARPRNSVLDLDRLGRVYGIVPTPWREQLDAALDRIAPSMEG